jgi:hypothetical protein
MIARCAIVVLTLLASSPALAETLDAEAARRFVVGKLLEFTCFDGSNGTGRVYDDGSVIGTIQFHGSGPVRLAWLPTGTLKVKGETVCASLNGSPIEQCFDLSRTDDQSFRGSVSGLDFAYCDFTHRLSIADKRPQPSEPLSPNAARNRRGH